MLKRLLLLLISFCIFSVPCPGHAETKVLTAEGTYTMGEGETMTFAESMAIQKAKQAALEQAGTYVESYTKVQNYQLTADEIQTIAGGVLQVDVLDKTRTLVGDGLKFFVKIKATVATDKVSELAQRVKGKNVAEEYKKLQEDYIRLSKEIDTWKQLITRTPPGPERDAALDQIREREKAFSVAQKSEAAFFQRLVSGEALFSKALGQLSKKQNEKSVVDDLFQKIVDQGHVITIGEPDVKATLKDPSKVEISMPVTLQISEPIRVAIQETAQSIGGETRVAIYSKSFGPDKLKLQTIRMGKDRETVQRFQERVARMVLVLELIMSNGSVRSCYIAPDFSADGLSGYVGYLAIAPIASFLSNEKIYRLGVSNFIDKKLDLGDGYVALLDNKVSITAATTISIAEAKEIKKIRGKLAEGVQDFRFAPSKVEGMPSCEVE